MKQQAEIDKFTEMIGRLDYMELETILNDLFKFGADPIFIDIVDMELKARIRNQEG